MFVERHIALMDHARAGLRIGVQQALNRLAADNRFADNCRHVGNLNARVHNPLRSDDDERTFLAKAVTAGDLDLEIERGVRALPGEFIA